MRLEKKKILGILLNILLFSTCLLPMKIPLQWRQNKALVTQACYGSFGLYHFLLDYSTVEILETDCYGRMIYVYNNAAPYAFGWEKQGYYREYFVCQKISSTYVYYYPENHYIMGQGSILSSQKIEQLKSINDWNKPIDFSKCIKKMYDFSYFISNSDKGITKEKICSILPSEEANNVRNVIYCDTDINGLKLFAVHMTNREYNYAIIFKNKDAIYSIRKIYSADYQDEITAFKNDNNWQYDYCG